MKKKKLMPFANLRPGRPVTLNIKELKPRAGRDYAEVLFFGDLHLGHPSCLVKKAKENLDYCLKNGIYVQLMGDMIECGLTTSIGDSVYAQTLNPQQQVEELLEMLSPLAEAGLILGYIEGNHESRIYKSSGINVAKMISGYLQIPYLFAACWSLWRVGSQNYTVYALHGSTGSRFTPTKLKAALDVSHFFYADIVAHAHVHEIVAHPFERQEVDLRNKVVRYKKQYVVVTGHYLGYKLSYAQGKGMPPSRVGSPKIKLFGDRHDIHEST